MSPNAVTLYSETKIYIEELRRQWRSG